MKALRCTECPAGVHFSPRISCVLTDVQPGKHAEEENPCPDVHSNTWLELHGGQGAWHPAPCNVTKLSPLVQAGAWALLGTIEEPAVGARLHGNLKLCPRDRFEMTRVQ